MLFESPPKHFHLRGKIVPTTLWIFFGLGVIIFWILEGVASFAVSLDFGRFIWRWNGLRLYFQVQVAFYRMGKLGFSLVNTS